MIRLNNYYELELFKLKKILPINLNPPIIGYTHHAYPLSILSLINNYEEWFLSNYIQIKSYNRFNDDDSFIDFDFIYHYYDNSPCLRTKKISEESQDFFSFLDLEKFIMDCLQNDMYVCLFVDYFYIPEFAQYQRHHITHELLIYGYDKEINVFHVAGFDKNRNYGSIYIKKTDLINGYIHRYETRFSFIQYPMYIYQIEPAYEYKFNLENVVDLLSDYLYSIDTPSKRNQIDRLHFFEHVHGIEAIEKMKSFYSIYKREDIRPIHIFWEHKKIMSQRIHYLTNKSLLTSSYGIDYINIVNKSLIVRNIILKYQVSSNTNVLVNVSNLIDEIVIEERVLLERIKTELTNQL